MRLKQVESWIKEKSNALSSLEKEFLNTSQNTLKKEYRTRRLRWVGVALATIFVAAVLILALTGQFDYFVYPPLETEWVEVPAGEFTMGSENGKDNEVPVHAVYLDAYEIGKYEVTNKEYYQCVQAGVCESPNNQKYSLSEYATHPVTDVNWYQARAYCQWTGARLPTEAEWEKAARGMDKRIYPWGNTLDRSYVNYSAGGTTTVVGSYQSGVSPYGAYDMAGNVWEWTSSLYKSYPYSFADGREDLDAAGSRVLRGGSWFGYADPLRSARRFESYPTMSNFAGGFRCSRVRP